MPALHKCYGIARSEKTYMRSTEVPRIEIWLFFAMKLLTNNKIKNVLLNVM